MTRTTDPTEPVADAVEDAAEDGFPVAVELPEDWRSAPLVIHTSDGRHHYDVPDDGVVQASTRARLELLLTLGGRPTNSPPAGSGDTPDDDGSGTTE